MMKRFDTGGAFSGRAFMRVMNTLRGSALMVGTSHAPAHSSVYSRPGVPMTSKPSADWNLPTSFDVKRTPNWTLSPAAMTHR